LFGATMLRFQRPPDAVFQAILRDSMSHSIDFIDDLIDDTKYDESRAREDMKGFYPAMAKVFPPSAATLLYNIKIDKKNDNRESKAKVQTNQRRYAI
jgi:hypothetical protein